jgi:hypothetical protein
MPNADRLRRVTLNFRLHEFDLSAEKAAEYGFEAALYPEDWITPRLLPLCQALEKIRVAVGWRPITILSGYRPEAYDLARIAAGHTGVSPTSQHHQGLAADIQIAEVPAEKVRESALRLHTTSQITLGGLGLYRSLNFVHVDLRHLAAPPARGTKARLATWEG